MIDWSKLEPYQSNKSRSFEELCYQIAKGLYEHKGRFTSIDDSGGGDGVEFYMTLPNGDQWGWQAKFYHPDPRLSVSNRKNHIERSLITSCQKHPHLKRWFLCTPSNFTPNGEQSWFDDTLPKSVPENMDVELVHWGDSEFNNWIREPRFGGIRNYFFGELELTIDWFRTQVKKQIRTVQDKFNEVLHTETTVDAHIHEFLGDTAFSQFIAEQVTESEDDLEKYREAVEELKNQGPYQVDWKDAKSELLAAVEPLQDALENAIEQLKQALDFLNEQRLDRVRLIDWDMVQARLARTYDAYREVESAFDTSKLTCSDKKEDRERILREVEQIVGMPRWAAATLMDKLRGVVPKLSHINQPDLHIFGDAAVGKTHIASHICHERLEGGLPALLMLGLHFTSDQPLQKQLLDILDVPASYSWSDFLQALEAAAEAYHTRIPLVIDGLNEAAQNGAFSNVWRLGLSGLIQEISQTNNIVLVTTCRTTYKEAIWSNGDLQNRADAYGFDAYDVEIAIEKYFSWYKIKADLTAAPLDQFQHPIYLKIFCESQNAKRQEETQVYVGESTLFDVFDKYLAQCNRAVCDRLGIYRKEPIVTRALDKMAQYLWQQHTRTISLTQLVEMVDGHPIEAINWGQSKTKAILDEGLLVCRDWYEGEDLVYFTYDLLGGYVIAQHLVKQAADTMETFVQSDETAAKLFSGDYQTLHPIHEDICRCLAVLLPVKTGKCLHELTDNEKAFGISINAIFEIPPDAIHRDRIDLVARLFEHPQNRKTLIGLAASTIGHVHHPLNASFWSEQLRALPIPERDISWTEYVRENVERFEKTLDQFEALCQSDEPMSEMTVNRLHLLAEHIMWVLTSTAHPLRDKATQALYWYGCRMPEQFFDLVLRSLEINDPYIPERMLAAAYGVVMARQYDFEDHGFAETILPAYGCKLYEAMFKPSAPHTTTHILTREYARRTIDIALVHHPDLLTAEEQKRITPPFIDSGIREWGESEDRNKGEYRDGNCPIDFLEDPLDWLGPKISKYETTTPEYKHAKANLWWRIYDLGYSLECFGDVDKWIVHSNHFRSYSEQERFTDHYGKKYCSIALHELAGYRDDLGLLKSEWHEPYERTLLADIDPSFPQPVQEFQVVDRDLLGDRTTPLHEWIENGDNPDMSSYFVLEELCGEKGPWVLLDGHISQEDLGCRRSCFIFPRGMFVQKNCLTEMTTFLQKQSLKGRWLPEIPDDHCTYAGEIPWCDIFPYNGLTELEFVISTKKKKVVLPSLVFNEEEMILSSVAKEQIVEEPDEKCVFKTFIPVRRNHWDGRHSSVTLDRSVLVLAKEIAEFLDLCAHSQTFDLYETNGKRASITIRWGEHWHTGHDLIFLRQDLLDHYLQEKKLCLLWVVWGERRFKSKNNEGLREFAEKHGHYKVFQEIKPYGGVKNC
jgi:hypothetical protein